MYLLQSQFVAYLALRGKAVPARDFKCRAENLGTHKFGHGDVWGCVCCDGRGWERIERGSGGAVA